VRVKERSYAHCALADARPAQKKQESRRPEKVIERIFNGELPKDQVTNPHLRAVCRACRSGQESAERELLFTTFFAACQLSLRPRERPGRLADREQLPQ
jgi:hypothetical protein